MVKSIKARNFWEKFNNGGTPKYGRVLGDHYLKKKLENIAKRTSHPVVYSTEIFPDYQGSHKDLNAQLNIEQYKPEFQNVLYSSEKFPDYVGSHRDLNVMLNIIKNNESEFLESIDKLVQNLPAYMQNTNPTTTSAYLSTDELALAYAQLNQREIASYNNQKKSQSTFNLSKYVPHLPTIAPATMIVNIGIDEGFANADRINTF